MRRPTSFCLALGVGLMAAGCSVQLRDDVATPSVSNVCHVAADCGTNAACVNGACFAKSGTIDEVLLEVVPDSNSLSGGLSFLTLQDGVAAGDLSRMISLPSRRKIDGQVEISGDALPDNKAPCNVVIGQDPIRLAAHIEFARVGSLGGVPILGLPDSSVILDTMKGAEPTSNWSFSTFLVPGSYDIYVEPVSVADCQIPPAIFRSVYVSETGYAGALPATIVLPTPTNLRGVVKRTGGTLADWQVDIIEPQDRRVISTTAVLGATNVPSSSTNFSVEYQPVVTDPNGSAPGVVAATPIGNSPLVRMTPPAAMAAQAPTVYWDLSTVDLSGNGVVSLDMSGLPLPSDLIAITGQVREQDANNNGVRSNLQFFSTSLEGAAGLTANFNQSAITDDTGHFQTTLFAGQYRVVAVPDVASSNDQAARAAPSSGSPAPSGAGVSLPWAITERQWTITKGTSQQDLILFPKRVLEGTASAGLAESPALGATLEAIPAILPSELGVLKGALGQTPILPQSASVAVSDDKATFALPLDPGAFDLSLRPGDSSNFAWWVWSGARITPPDAPGQTISVDPQLQLPVPLEGTIRDPSGIPLANSVVRAYARAPAGTAVTKVAEARTDDMGRYQLRLPAKFGP